MPAVNDSYEYKHLECPESWVNAILQQYAAFFWELVGTQTVVSKESHLERGKGLFDSDVIYSVTTAERFVTLDLKRSRNLPNYEKIKVIESQCMSIYIDLNKLGCSPVDNYETMPPMEDMGLISKIVVYYILVSLFVFPAYLYWKHSKKRNKEKLEERLTNHRGLKAQLNQLLDQNRGILNI